MGVGGVAVFAWRYAANDLDLLNGEGGRSFAQDTTGAELGSDGIVTVAMSFLV